jgi:hypothetical protein
MALQVRSTHVIRTFGRQAAPLLTHPAQSHRHQPQDTASARSASLTPESFTSANPNRAERPISRRRLAIRHSCGNPCEPGGMLRAVDERDKWTIFHFSQSNAAGDGQGDVPPLLRRVADTLEELGDVQVQDVTFSSEVTEGEDDLTMTVYYHPSPRRRLEAYEREWLDGSTSGPKTAGCSGIGPQHAAYTWAFVTSPVGARAKPQYPKRTAIKGTDARALVGRVGWLCWLPSLCGRRSTPGCP